MTGYQIKELIEFCKIEKPLNDTARAFGNIPDPLEYNQSAHQLLIALEQIQKDIRIAINRWKSKENATKNTYNQRSLDSFFMEELDYLLDLSD